MFCFASKENNYFKEETFSTMESGLGLQGKKKTNSLMISFERNKKYYCWRCAKGTLRQKKKHEQSHDFFERTEMLLFFKKTASTKPEIQYLYLLRSICFLIKRKEF